MKDANCVEGPDQTSFSHVSQEKLLTERGSA